MTKDSNEFQILLNSISSTLSLKVLLLYEKNIHHNLTETSKLLNEPISTIQDNLRKLEKANLIKKNIKNYSITNLGSYILNSLKRFNILSKFIHIFGNLPSESIPSEILYEFLPNFINIETSHKSFDFLQVTKNLMENFLNITKKSEITLEIIGWWDLNLDLQLARLFGIDFNLEKGPIPPIIKNINFKIITDKSFIENIKKYDKIFNRFEEEFNFMDRVKIYDENYKFHFTLFKLNHIITFSLVKDNDIDYHNYFIVENNPKISLFFEKLYNYFNNRSKPLKEFLFEN